MEYDPIKRRLGKIFKRNTFSLKIFYSILNLLFLRTWYIHREIKRFEKSKKSKSSLSVLDAGSGFGQYSWHIARKHNNWRVKAIDIKKDEINECQYFFKKAGINNVAFEVQDLTAYVKENAYDLILSVDVLEHILEDVKVMKSAYISLKEDGVFLISTPSDQGGSDIHHEGDESFISEHVRDGYSIDDIAIKLKIAGFSEIRAMYSYGVFGSLSWRFSIKYPIKMLNLSKLFVAVLPLYYLATYPFCYIMNHLDLLKQNNKGTGLIVAAYKKSQT